MSQVAQIESPAVTSTPIMSGQGMPSGSMAKKDLAIRTILNSQPKLAPKPILGELELVGPHVGSLSPCMESSVSSSGVKTAASLGPVSSCVLHFPMPGQNGFPSVHTTVGNTHLKQIVPTRISTITAPQVVVTEQEKQHRLLQQQQRFRTQVDKLQKIWSQRSHQNGSPSEHGSVLGADQESTTTQATDGKSSSSVESWKHDKNVVMVQTQNHAKAVAKHSEEVGQAYLSRWIMTSLFDSFCRNWNILESSAYLLKRRFVMWKMVHLLLSSTPLLKVTPPPHDWYPQQLFAVVAEPILVDSGDEGNCIDMHGHTVFMSQLCHGRRWHAHSRSDDKTQNATSGEPTLSFWWCMMH